MSECVLLIVDAPGMVLGSRNDLVGHYIEKFDPHFQFPIGRVYTTPEWRKAKRFSDSVAALEFWKQQVGDKPRADGKPNRPLTALTIEVVPTALLEIKE